MSRPDHPDAAALAGQDADVIVSELRSISEDATGELTDGEIETLTAFYSALPPISRDAR
ncbi:c-type cytochrome [Pseudoroseicyclus tamaricis]|uniref:Uncharacterized protein n=1 Tax=Pseudoroseicyclus tamaricis TaxID=2705421 RepID=A0A6B2JQQ8_9RHOB|nr:hypothetical protein [Pseudoroseicyclus tamaricis]NDV00295.1 hypothetical protein [Pseudoroseicyclus tamaricis]